MQVEVCLNSYQDHFQNREVKCEVDTILHDSNEELQLIHRVLNGEIDAFEPIVKRYQPRIFAMARRYARQESEVEDIVQDVFIKAFQKLSSYRGDAPFEHWLMRIAIRTCYDYLRTYQRKKESNFTELTKEDEDLLNRIIIEPNVIEQDKEAAKALVNKLLEMLSPDARLVITLIDIEGKTIKEVSKLTGWTIPSVKVRAFRARAQMRKLLKRIVKEKYL